MSFQLILITSPEDFADEHVLLEAMFNRGLQRLHVRKPHKNADQLRNWIVQLPHQVRKNLVVHGPAEIAKDFAMAGYHGLDYGPNVETNELPDSATGLSQKLSWSVSLHELPKSSSVHQWDYAFLSPIFDSFSKPGYQGAWDLGRLGHYLEEHPLPLVALGGVDESRLSTLYHMGFYGAAVLGAVWNSFDPLGTWDALYKKSQEVQGIKATRYKPVQSWRDLLEEKRGGYNPLENFP